MPDTLPDASLETLGYKPQLRRVLTRMDLVLYGLVILTPTAPYPVFGIVQKLSNGHAALCFLVAMVGMLFTAASYGQMSGAFPTAGSTYTYTQRGLNEHVGFLAGWAMILDYLLIPLLSVVYAALTAARLVPQVPYLAWAVLFSAAITLTNLRGVKVTAKASRYLMWTMSVCAVLFIVLSVRKVLLTGGAGALLRPDLVFNPSTFSLRPLMLGAGVATLSYIGFDAISTLAEDTLHPERDLSFATVLVCLVQTFICVVTVYCAALVWPDYRSFPDPETAILDIGRLVGGQAMFGLITLALLVAGLASAMTGQAGASRLLFGMGRDGVISRRFFGYVDPKTASPTRNVYLMGAVSLAGCMLARFEFLVQLLNFGAFVGFIMVNLSVFSHYYLRLHRRSGSDLFFYCISPLSGALICFYVWISLADSAKLIGFAWMFAGMIYLAFLTNGFRKPPVKLEVS